MGAAGMPQMAAPILCPQKGDPPELAQPDIGVSEHVDRAKP
jgi:hypothetical protein